MLIDSIEVNFVISHNLDPPCSSYEENIAAEVQRVVIEPLLLASELIKLKLEEQDDGARSADKSCLIDQVHLPEIFIINVLECKVWLLFLLGGLNIGLFKVLITWDFKYRHSIGLPLSVKGVDLIVLLIVEWFHWEVLVIRILYWNRSFLAKFLTTDMIKEMNMESLLVVEQIYE